MTLPVAETKSGQIQVEPQLAAQASTPGSPSSSLSAHTSSVRPSHHHKTSVLLALQSLLHLIVIAIFIITFCAQPFRIPSESMESTLLVGDFLLVNKQAGSPNADESGGPLPSPAIHRGDIIVFHDPVDATLHLVKRVIGLPGDHLRLHQGRVFINGHVLSEPYAVYRPSPPDNFRDNFPRLQSADPEIDSRWWVRMRKLIDNGELIVPDGNYFVLGDNRNDSEDSRYWGFVPAENIVGRPLLVYFSLRQGPDGDPLAISTTAAAASTGLQFARWDRTLRVIR